MIKAIFFDVGHTLIRNTGNFAETCRRVLAEHGHAATLDDVRRAMRAADRMHKAHYHALHDDWARPDTIVTLWRRYYAHLFDHLGIVDHEARLAHTLIDWYATPAAWQPFPETRATLAALRERGLQLGAISDWGPSLTSILHTHGLSRYLHWVLGSGNIGLCKPSAHFYALALRRAGVQPREAIHVGDSYYADVRGARAAGITPVLIDRYGHAPPVDCHVIRSLHEIHDLL